MFITYDLVFLYCLFLWNDNKYTHGILRITKMVDRKRAFIMAFMTENRSSIIHFYPLFFFYLYISTHIHQSINQWVGQSDTMQERENFFIVMSHRSLKINSPMESVSKHVIYANYLFLIYATTWWRNKLWKLRLSAHDDVESTMKVIWSE